MYENEDQLLWQPDSLSEQRVKDYLRDSAAPLVDGKVATVPQGCLVQDNEQVNMSQRLHMYTLAETNLRHD